MRKALICIFLALSCAALSATSVNDSPEMSGTIVQMPGSFLRQIQERDSVLIADQLLYGFSLQQVEEGTNFAFPVIGDTLMTNIRIVNNWHIDTVNVSKQKKGLPRLLDLEAGVTITSFEEGVYVLPPLAVQRMTKDGVVDTLVFDSHTLEVMTMPVDTATFKPHDIKGQIRYPLTFKEVAPWVAGGLAVCALIVLIAWLVMKYICRDDPRYVRKDPPHIVALRKLDKYRGNSMWVPEKQKVFYSGITDALREYISDRYGVGAMEMTTAEMFAEIKKTDMPEDLQTELRKLFERADFVKFAKFVASDEDNATALPTAVRFVTATYQVDVVESQTESQDDRKGGK